jgi:site-specific DNA-methyltransferase (adenine-specific)
MSYTAFLDGRVTLYAGDCLDVLATMPENSVDSVVCDPPYHLTSIVKRFGADMPPRTEATVGKHAYGRHTKGFMGRTWDGGDIAFQPDTWRAVLRVLKPGGYLLAFASTRGFGRMSVAIEDAGFVSHPLILRLFEDSPEILRFLQSLTFPQLEAFVRLCDQRDNGMLAWIFGSGFPKATRIKAEGYDGFRYGGQALKPAIEPIYMGQKPFSEASGTANILRWGTGALNIDGCRIETSDDRSARYAGKPAGQGRSLVHAGSISTVWNAPDGRWPANIIHDGSEEVLAAFPESPGQQQHIDPNAPSAKTSSVYGAMKREGEASADRRYTDKGATNFAALPGARRNDAGSAARFFYTAKADAEDRLGSKHPTVKPLDLMQYLCRLVTPPGGTILDPFAGTGTTGEAAWREGFKAILIEREAEYQADIAHRMDLAVKPTKRAAVAKTKGNLQGAEGTPLFSNPPSTSTADTAEASDRRRAASATHSAEIAA